MHSPELEVAPPGELPAGTVEFLPIWIDRVDRSGVATGKKILDDVGAGGAGPRRSSNHGDAARVQQRPELLWLIGCRSHAAAPRCIRQNSRSRRQASSAQALSNSFRSGLIG